MPNYSQTKAKGYLGVSRIYIILVSKEDPYLLITPYSRIIPLPSSLLFSVVTIADGRHVDLISRITADRGKLVRIIKLSAVPFLMQVWLLRFDGFKITIYTSYKLFWTIATVAKSKLLAMYGSVMILTKTTDYQTDSDDSEIGLHFYSLDMVHFNEIFKW